MTTPTAAKLAPPVDISEADSERQKMYGGLSDARNRAFEDPSIKPAETPDFAEIEVDPDLPVVTDEDKKAFVRAVLGNKVFEKTYTLFGSITVVFADRTVVESEALYDSLKTITDPDEWRLALEQRQLSSAVKELAGNGILYKVLDKGAPKIGEVLGNGTEVDFNTCHVIRFKQISAFSKPLYKALLQTSRRFEILVSTLTDSAHIDSFWPAGGATSQSALTSPARSTTGAPAVRTGR